MTQGQFCKWADTLTGDFAVSDQTEIRRGKRHEVITVWRVRGRYREREFLADRPATFSNEERAAIRQCIEQIVGAKPSEGE